MQQQSLCKWRNLSTGRERVRL